MILALDINIQTYLLTYLLDTLFLRVCVVKLTFAGGGEHSGGDRRRQGV